MLSSENEEILKAYFEDADSNSTGSIYTQCPLDMSESDGFNGRPFEVALVKILDMELCLKINFFG